MKNKSTKIDVKSDLKRYQKNDAKKDVTLEALGHGNLGELRTESADSEYVLNKQAVKAKHLEYQKQTSRESRAHREK